MSDERWTAMVRKYGSEEGARAEMARRAKLGSGNKTGKGGFRDIDEQTAREIRSKGGFARAEKLRLEKQAADQSQDPDKTND